jgi:hypothetical protein
VPPGLANAADLTGAWAVELELAATTSDPDEKLAAEADDAFARLSFRYAATMGDSWSFDGVVDAVTAGSAGIDITEAYVTWRPVPHSAIRQSLRVGAFYPPLSLENTGDTWTSPYSDSFSAINTWVGEELRTIGAEWSPSLRFGNPSRQREIRGIVAAYCCNDPAGTLLAWRGFALHQRQSRLGDALELPAVPQIQPGMMFAAQAPATEPFRETDHATGYYLGLDAKLAPSARLAALHYDNHTDPLSAKDGNYGWTTRFDHLGAQFELPSRLGLLVQWLDGTTVMGPVMNGAHVVDNAFKAYMLLLTRRHGRHRWTLRLDDFSVTDRDTTPLDDNYEEGRATTVAYRLSADDAPWDIGVEWIGLELERPARAYFGDAPKADDNLVRFGARYRLDPSMFER